MKWKNLVCMIGKKFGRLIVVGDVPLQKCRRKWKVQCVCGTEKTVFQDNLKRGNTKSCGCLNREIASKTCNKKAPAITHGLSYTSEYHSWGQMKQRCYNKKEKRYKDYGGRGISVCKRWHKFENFITDMGLRPTPQHSIDRIDNNGNYEPNNCKWSTSKEQNINRRKRKRGKTL